MDNSSLVDVKIVSPFGSKRTSDVIFFTAHCVVGLCSAEALGKWFQKAGLNASANYGIDKDGRVLACFDSEDIRAWTSSSTWNDDRAITVECASEVNSPWAFPDATYAKLVDLAVDVCKRYG